MSVYDDASLVLIPSGYKASKLYSVVPSDGTGDLSFSRSTTATRINENGVRETVSINVPRIDFTGGGCGKLLLEPQRTNLYLNSATLVTQNVSTSATTYTVSFEGTGTVTFSGTYSGSLVGTGANYRVSLTFTATSGTLTSTISGSCTNGQAEVGSYPTSYIPTAGTIVTRGADASSTTGLSSVINSVEGVFYIKMAAISASTNDTIKITISDGSNNNSLTLSYNNSGRLDVNLMVGGVFSFIFNYASITSEDVNSIAVRWKANDFSLWVNGVSVLTDTSGSVASADTFDRLNFSTPNSASDFFYGKISDLVLADYLTDTQMAALTTL